MRPRTADYEMKPMLGDETEEEIPGASFAAPTGARIGRRREQPSIQWPSELARRGAVARPGLRSNASRGRIGNHVFSSSQRIAHPR